MGHLLKTLVAVSILFVYIHSTDVAPTEVKNTEQNCTEVTFMKIATCFWRLADYMRKMFFLDMEKIESLKSFKSSCDSLQECMSSLSCGKDASNKHRDVGRKMKTYCSGVGFFVGDFSECINKVDMESKNISACFKTWDPFFIEVENEEGTNVTTKGHCKNFFGEGNCMKDVVVDSCSQEEWAGLRDHFISITPEVKDCKFDNL